MMAAAGTVMMPMARRFRHAHGVGAAARETASVGVIRRFRVVREKFRRLCAPLFAFPGYPYASDRDEMTRQTGARGARRRGGYSGGGVRQITLAAARRLSGQCFWAAHGGGNFVSTAAAAMRGKRIRRAASPFR